MSNLCDGVQGGAVIRSVMQYGKPLEIFNSAAMNSDPFYRQLVKVLQDSGREVTSTRQSARYKDDLQTARTISTNVVKQKPKRKFKVEMPSYYSEDKVAAIFEVVGDYTKARRSKHSENQRSRIVSLQERIALLKDKSGAADRNTSSSSVYE